MTFTRSVRIGSYNAVLMLSETGEFRVSWSSVVAWCSECSRTE